MHSYFLSLIVYYIYIKVYFNFVLTLFVPDEWLETPEELIGRKEELKTVAVSKNTKSNITKRFIYMVLACNYSAKIMRDWVAIYCFIWCKKDILFRNKSFKDTNFLCGLIDISE